MTKSEAKQVEQFAALMQKSTEELQQILQSMHLSSGESKQEMVRAIVQAGFSPQMTDQPQALAIKTAQDEEAQEFVRKANARILPQGANKQVIRSKIKRRQFTFVNRDGQEYSISCPCVALKPETAEMILNKGWVMPLENQVQLIQAMKEDITQFECYLIRKRDSRSKFYLMMHVVKKAA